MNREQMILDAWRNNATPWINAIRDQTIESRRLVTDDAIVEAVQSCHPRTVIDLGCGEGWLSHRLATLGMEVTGIDPIPALIAEAQRKGPGEFLVLSYEEIAEGKLDRTADVLVCNFSLLGKASVENLIRTAPTLLHPGGSLIIQTLHPRMVCGVAPYEDGWREGTWAGICDTSEDPAPWYFRTLESWENLIEGSGLKLRERREPIHPKTGEPASVIFVAEMVNNS